MTEPTRIVVTGASRGLGFEVARRYAELGYSVAGTYLEPSADVDELRMVGCDLYRLRIEDEADRHALGSSLTERWGSVDVLINNAGTNAKVLNAEADRAITTVSEATLLAQYLINAVAPILLAREVLPLLRRGTNPTIVNVGSRSGLLQWSSESTDPGYAASKAALHALTTSLGASVAPEGIRIFVVHPGWLRTRIGGGRAPESPADGAARMVDSIRLARDGTRSAGFIDAFGNLFDWAAASAVE